MARSLLEAGPSLAGHPLAAVVTGDAARVEAVLKADPSWVTSVDDTRGWSPLLYACYSRWHTDSAERAEGILGTAGKLLDAGAPSDSHNGRLPNRGYRSALHGSVMVDHPALCRLLLERGARPDDRVSLELAARSGARGCLRELLAHGATVSGTWALGAAGGGGGDAGSVELSTSEWPTSRRTSSCSCPSCTPSPAWATARLPARAEQRSWPATRT